MVRGGLDRWELRVLGAIWSPLLCSADHCWGLLCCPDVSPTLCSLLTPLIWAIPQGVGATKDEPMWGHCMTWDELVNSSEPAFPCQQTRSPLVLASGY